MNEIPYILLLDLHDEVDADLFALLSGELAENGLMQAALADGYTVDELRMLMTDIMSKRLNPYLVRDDNGQRAWRLDRLDLLDGPTNSRRTLAEWRDELRQGQGGTQ